MAASTGPALTVGAITWANVVLLEPGGDTFKDTTRIAVATGIVVGGLALIERASEPAAKGIAWLALVTVLFTRIGGRRSPAENLLRWYNQP